MDSQQLMSLFVAYLRALYQIHQNAHWKSSGDSFYGDHLLFERLYNATQETADQAAEKTIGLFDELDDLTNVISEIVEKFNFDKYESITSACLAAEQEFQKLCKKVYDDIKKDKSFTLGLDDMLMEIASKHEVHIYLLKQTTKS